MCNGDLVLMTSTKNMQIMLESQDAMRKSELSEFTVYGHAARIKCHGLRIRGFLAPCSKISLGLSHL